MRYYATAISAYDKNRLEHFGIKGQRWGIRRFQNEDGTLTEEGKKRYTYSDGRQSKMSLAGRLKFGKKYADEYNESERIKSMGGKTNKEYDQEARKEFKEASEQDDKMMALNKRMDSFDKATPDEKLKIIDEVDRMQTKIGEEQGYGSPAFEDMNDWFWDHRSKAGEAKFKELDSLPKGQKRDDALTKLLGDSDREGQDSIYVDALIDRMQERHGDYLSGNFKSEASKKLINEFGEATDKADETRKKFYQEDQKRGIYPKDYSSSTGFLHREKLEADHPEVKQTMDAQESKWKEYCVQVLKDMDLPVNEKTIEYIQHVIIWN